MRGPPAVQPREATLLGLLTSAAKTDSGLTFVDSREDEQFVPFAELHRRARKAATGLREVGIRRGDRVALVLPTGPSFVDSFFGVLLAGGIPVPLYPLVRLGRMDEYHAATTRMLKACGARAVVSEGRIRLLLGKALAEARPECGLLSASDLLESPETEFEAAANGDDLGLIQFSSGSTTAPKPVGLTHRNLVYQCAALHALLPEPAGTRQLGVSWLPLYHDMGLIGCLLSAFHQEAPLVLLPPEAFLARPSLWLRAISRHKASISPAPNFAFGLCLKRIRDEELAGLDLSSWHYALNGAEPVVPGLMRRFCERFAPCGFQSASLMPVYGLSEASLAVTFSPRRTPLRTTSVDAGHLAAKGELRPGGREIASVGTPIPGTEVEVRDVLTGASLREGKVGHIHVRGPSVMPGYFARPEATSKVFSEGWLDTGDLGFWSGGELHICGRAKDLVIVRGANHAPQEFEECLDGLGGIRVGCAVALGFIPEDGETEELLILAETAGDPRQGLEEQVRGAITSRTGIRPHTVRLLAPGTLPRTSSGKLRRQEALRLYLAGGLKAPLEPTLWLAAREILKSTAARLTAKRRP